MEIKSFFDNWSGIAGGVGSLEKPFKYFSTVEEMSSLG